MKNKLYIELPVEKNLSILQEYGRGIILTNNVEYFLKNSIEKKGKKINRDKSTLGSLVKDAKNYLPTLLIELLDDLNKDRIKLIHGTMGTTKSFKTQKESHFIQKDNEEIIINIEFLKKYSNSARNILQKLIILK